MEKQLDRIEAKLEAIDKKMDNHVERIVSLESSNGWVKSSLAIIVSALGGLAAFVFKVK